MKPLILLACASLLLVTGARCRDSQGTTHYSGVYISLGDSVAAGNGSSDKAATSYAALLARDEGNLDLRNYAVAGATTQDVIDKQLPDALSLDGEIAFITISVGGNDLAGLIPNAACRDETLPAACPLDETLRGVETRYSELVARLRAAHPDTPIVLLGYPNFFSGTGHVFEAPATRVMPRLDDVIRGAAAKYPHAGVADAAPAFEGRGRELTHVLDPQFDPHPTDAGHRLIADAFIAALAAIK